jgi:hypothetical protein
VKRISLLLFAAAMLLFSVSCASTPKKTTVKDTPLNDQSQNELPQAAPETQPSDAETAAAEPVTADDTVQPETDTDYSDLEEAVPPDETNAAPAEERQPQTTDAEKNTIAEPLVHDEPYIETTTPSSQPQVNETPKAAQPGKDDSADRKKSEKAAKSTETTPVKSLAKKQSQPSVSRMSSPGSDTSSVPAKGSSEVINKTTAANLNTAGQTESTDTPPGKSNPSRSVTIDKNQYLDVTYPGTGWIYLGESDGTKNMIFFGRKLGETNTSFTLRSRDAGKSLLHFYKNDVLTGKYIDDYLEVNVTNAVSGSQEHAVAPSYEDVVPPRPASAAAQEAGSKNLQQTDAAGKENRQSASAASQEEPQKKRAAGTAAAQEQDAPIKTVIQTTESAPNASSPATAAAAVPAGNVSAKRKVTQKPVLNSGTAKESADDLLREAQTAYDAKQYEKSQELLTFFFDKAVSRIDEGLYLQGEVLEAQSPIQNIKGAIDSYGILMKNWPGSTLWKNAQQRSIYLKRMYIDIR